MLVRYMNKASKIGKDPTESRFPVYWSGKDGFKFKDVIPKELLSGLVYRFWCGGCNATYYGKTIRHFKVRECEHLGISHLTGKTIKPKESGIFDHLTTSPNCNATIDYFDILSRENNQFRLLLKESLFLKRDDPSLNRTIKSYPLLLYD